MKGKKLGMLVMTGPDRQDIRQAIGLANAAMDGGASVEIFLMHNGVLNAALPALDALAQRGAQITVCAHNADELKAFRNERFKYGSQYDHAHIINESDRYLAFV